MSTVTNEQTNPTKVPAISLHVGSDVINTPFFRTNDTDQELDRDQKVSDDVLKELQCADDVLRDLYRGVPDPDTGFTIGH